MVFISAQWPKNLKHYMAFATLRCFYTIIVHHHNTCNSPYLSLYLSTLWSYRNSKLKKMFTLKGCFDGDGGLFGSGGSVGSWPNARLRQMTRIRYLFMFNFKLRICFLRWKTQVSCAGFCALLFHDYLPISKQFD